MSASDYDDTDLTLDDLREVVRHATPVQVSNLGGTTEPERYATGSTATWFTDGFQLAGNVTITRTLELADR